MARFKRLQQQSDFECLFWVGESCPLRLHASNNDVQKHVDMLKITQEREREFFWQEAAASNLLAFLYLMIEEQESALRQLKLSLEKDPHNLNAKLGMIRLLEERHQGSDAQKKIDHLQTLKEDGKEMRKQISICQGEIAYACSFIGPDFYVQATDRYEALMDVANCDEVKDELNGYIVRWKYYLAYTYNRMLNKGHKEKLAAKLGTKDVPAIFGRISELYDAVIASDDKFYKGKAMIDLVDTYKKCETSGSNPEIPFPHGSPDKFVKQALDTAPSDPHVLERCGRHYRQRASSKKDFKDAIKIFDSLLEIHPTRHVAWHHKGLAYRSMWLVVGKYNEANLYNNRARKGNKKRVRNQEAIETLPVGLHADGAGAAAEFHENLNLNLSASQLPCGSVVQLFDEGYLSMLADEGPAGAQEIPPTSLVALPSAPRQLPTLVPWKSQDIGDVPRQLKKPDFYDQLRTRNPPAKDGGSRQYLVTAKECFEEAKQITKGTCSPYIVDLARCHISLGSYDDAEAEFNVANKLARTMNNNDATYLYEQWALLRHHRAGEEAAPEETRQKMKDAACLYRQAILSAVRARERSRIAFYRLRDLLREELKHDANNEALRMEHEVLNNSVQNYSQCRERETLVEAMKQDEDTRCIAWDLIRLLRERRHRHDAAIAFVYLSALREAGQLNLEKSAATPDTVRRQESNRQLLINVVRELVREGDQTNADSGQTFGEIFRWLVGTRHISDYITLDRDSPRPFVNSAEVCILAPSDVTPGVDTVLRLLRDICGLMVVRGFCEGNCDIRWESPTSEGLRAVVSVSQAVVVVEHSTDTGNWNQLFPVLEELMKLREVKTCLVADENTDFSKTEQRYVQHWPRLVISRNCGDGIELAYSLLKTMFP